MVAPRCCLLYGELATSRPLPSTFWETWEGLRSSYRDMKNTHRPARRRALRLRTASGVQRGAVVAKQGGFLRSPASPYERWCYHDLRHKSVPLPAQASGAFSEPRVRELDSARFVRAGFRRERVHHATMFTN